MDIFSSIKTPRLRRGHCTAIKRNMGIAADIKNRAGVKILLATKAFSMFSVFDTLRETLDGTTASGLYEARLGHIHFGKEVHCYSPAYTQEELNETLQYSEHIYFNSVSQLQKFAHLTKGKTVGPAG